VLPIPAAFTGTGYMNKKHCHGCRDDFYNGHNPYGVEECWMLKDAKLVTKFELSTATPMNIRSAYTKLKRPNCYNSKGYVYLDTIPGYAK
jgi:hypothetical protein